MGIRELLRVRGRALRDPGPAMALMGGLIMPLRVPDHGLAGWLGLVAFVVASMVGWTLVWDRAPARIRDRVLGPTIAAAVAGSAGLFDAAVSGGAVPFVKLIVWSACMAGVWLLVTWLVPMRPPAPADTGAPS